MPTYFFDVTGSEHSAADEEGSQLENVAEVRAIALDTVIELARRRSPSHNNIKLEVFVRDEADVHVYKAALTISGEWES